jgi:muramoyltetrapeptide carboxypeptidase
MLSPAVKVLQEWGLEPVLSPNLFRVQDQFAGSDEERAADLQQMLDDPSIKAIISARGGYGTIRIVDQLDFSLFKKQPKWIIGYSDITVLHSHLHTLGFETLHATMPVNFGVNEEATLSLKNMLFGSNASYTFGPHTLDRRGNASGPLVGGNLSLLYALNGSISDIDTTGKILFLEDLDEYLYHVDRMMVSMKRSGKLKGLAGLIVGGMTEMKDNEIPFGKTAEQIVFDAVKDYDYPVCFDFPAGHVDRNLAMILGRRVNLKVDKNKSSLAF